MKIVLDTNAYCLCDTTNDFALGLVEKAKSLFLPAVVYGELYYGFRYGTRFGENLKRLDQFIEHFDVGIIEVNREVARHFGDIYASLRKKGRPIPTNDIWISACCMSVGGTLLTSDRHFREVDQVDVEIIPDF
ncbi:MAG: type II toxin-antitoxin system VapC family toxin [Deltaproteobacteria bacterium]|nr:type II toxin-antitoxin system VapC family toxin [Deltaproteobacteria bacterium]